MENQLTINGVNNLKDFGYPNVNEENIFTDKVYSAMFKNMLMENKGHGSEIDQAIDNLISKIKTDG